MTIPIGIVLPDIPFGGWTQLGPQARAAEDAGAAAVWLTDHLFWHRPAVDVIGGLQTVAAATTACTIGPCALQLPLRDVPSTAKSLAYLAELAPGRTVACLGIGEWESEYRAAGKGDRFHRRGRLLDAGIDELRAAWDADADGLSMAPAGPVPLWIAGRSDAARRRAARTGDGWIPHLCRAPWFAEQMVALTDDLDRAGREPGSVTRTAVINAAIDGIEPDADPLAWMGRLYALPPKAFAKALVRGSAAQVAEEVHRFEAAGAEAITLFLASDHPVDHLAALIDAAA
ncbi:MAG: putative F420-dependent oxidoreductase [Ilumatobacteraceae bacterium]|nr:putative F420-dependent oxidoreductase [Ilumatobacteraceae bacterium]